MKVKSDLGNMGVSPEGRSPSSDGGVGQFGDSGSTVHPEYEAKPIDELAPGVAVPDKPFELREAKLKKPSNYEAARKVPNPYPTVDAALDPYPHVTAAIEEEAGIVEDNDHLEKLGIESPDEFGVKFKGQLDALAEEHDLGDLLGYALTDFGIIIWGSENILKLDYDLENPDIKPVYYFEQEPEAEMIEPIPGEPAGELIEVEEEPVEEPAAE